MKKVAVAPVFCRVERIDGTPPAPAPPSNAIATSWADVGICVHIRPKSLLTGGRAVGRSQYPPPSGVAAMAATGLVSDWLAIEPRNGALPNAKIPPSSATSQ